MRRRQWLGTLLSAAVIVTFVAAEVQGQTTAIKDAVAGNPNIQSIEFISFAPDGVLLIGDGKGRQIVAVETADTAAKKWEKGEVADFQAALAARLGIAAGDVDIRRMAVNPSSHTAYFAVRHLGAKKDILLSVDGSGKIAEESLDNVKHVAVPLPADQNVTSVTGVTWAGDRVLVTALAKETFANKCFSIMAPLVGNGQCGAFTTETYHVAHGKWETNAPIRTMMPYEENGKRFLVGAFLCTPIVKYGLDDLQPSAKVKGISVIELGMGNTPQYMFPYEKAGKKYILMNCMRMGQMQKSNPVGPSEFWTAKVDYTILQETEKVNQDALWRTGNRQAKANVTATERVEVAEAFHGVSHMAALDSQRALVLRKDGAKVHLQVLPLP